MSVKGQRTDLELGSGSESALKLRWWKRGTWDQNDCAVHQLHQQITSTTAALTSFSPVISFYIYTLTLSISVTEGQTSRTSFVNHTCSHHFQWNLTCHARPQFPEINWTLLHQAFMWVQAHSFRLYTLFTNVDKLVHSSEYKKNKKWAISCLFDCAIGAVLTVYLYF